MPKKITLLPILLLAVTALHAQLPALSPRDLEKVSEQAGRLDHALTGQAEKYLQKMEAQEVRLKNKLQKTDPATASRLFGDIAERYGRLQASLHTAQPGMSQSLTTYVPSLDTLKNTLLFVKNNGGGEALPAALEKVQGLQARLGVTDQLKSTLDQRRQYLQQELERSVQQPLQKAGMQKDLQKMQSTISAYKQQLHDYRQMLQDPSLLRQRAITALSQLPACQQFIRQNSFFAGIFGQPDSYQLSDSSLKGLQTRASVQQTIREKTAVGGPQAGQQVTSQLQQATASLSRLMTSLRKQADPEDPAGAPARRNTHSFWRHMEYGADLQFQRPNTLLPVTADLALNLGYTVKDKATLGLGVAGKFGLGNGLQDIHFSGQGLGLRSYIDWKWKKSLYLSGGYEWNYLSQFRSISQLQRLSAWQPSGLIGLSKKYRVSSRVQGKMQLLFDILSSTQTPRTPPILFRVGWTF